MDFEKLKEFRNNSKGFINEVGLVITEIWDGEAEGRLQLEERHANPIGSIHGGCLYAVADTVGGVAAASKGCMVTTVDGSMHYLNAAHVGDALTVRAHVVKAGKTLAVVDISIENQEKILIATGTMTYYYLKNIDFHLLSDADKMNDRNV